ncbi:MAG: MarR family transcriptional regulator [Kordiimonadaceae bacterium]|jgi:ribosomal protein S18 acetylase RimI-like enzyme/DNA-binding MarR family transcriptional regulator|nr:MarR family transcriptional regulator [Kordiimonadaceae bacterium]
MSEELFLEIGIGTRCRRIFEYLSLEMDGIYQSEGVDISIREFPIFYCLYHKGPQSIANIQQLSGLSHSAVSQTVKKLVAKKMLSLKIGDDARSKIVAFSIQGNQLLKKLIPIWETAKYAMDDVLSECDTNILDAFADYEEAFKNKSFTARYNVERDKKKISKVEIIPYHIKYRDDWRRINQQWIETLFVMEEVDIIGLTNPEEYVLAKGGEIYFGLVDGKAVGAIALKKEGDTLYELSKMGVVPEAQGHGIGRLLVEKVIERFHARGGKKLYLDTNSSLKPAINLYKKTGFKQMAAPNSSIYDRSDYYMELVK